MTNDAPGDGQPPARSRLRSVLKAPVNLLVAVVAAQTLLGAIVLLGYIYRRMQRRVVLVWSDGRILFRAPNWLVGEASEAKQGSRFNRVAGSLLENLTRGVGAAVGLAALVLPVGGLLAVSWYAGWNNSFNKGYEFAVVGPLMGLSGVVLGMVVLQYLPLAQARHALTCDWRTLFDWRLNLVLLSCRPFALIPVVLAGVLLALVLLGARGLLTFAPQIPAFSGSSDDPAGFLGSWFFCWGFPFVAVLFWLKTLGAKLYARAVLKGLARGGVGWDTLHDEERRLLSEHGHECKASVNGRHRNLSAWIFLPAAFLAGFATFLLLYAQQFVNYVGVWGWLNHPMLWLPIVAHSP